MFCFVKNPGKPYFQTGDRGVLIFFFSYPLSIDIINIGITVVHLVCCWTAARHVTETWNNTKMTSTAASECTRRTRVRNHLPSRQITPLDRAFPMTLFSDLNLPLPLQDECCECAWTLQTEHSHRRYVVVNYLKLTKLKIVQLN